MGRPGICLPSSRGGRGRALAARGCGLLSVESGLLVESGVGKGRIKSLAASLVHQWGWASRSLFSCLNPLRDWFGDGLVGRQGLSLPIVLHPSQPPV